MADPLKKLFAKHQIVFWYDTDKELRTDFEKLEIPNINKIELVNNEFNVKHRILREEPDNKFLLYHEDPQPDDLDNWLLYKDKRIEKSIKKNVVRAQRIYTVCVKPDI